MGNSQTGSPHFRVMTSSSSGRTRRASYHPFRRAKHPQAVSPYHRTSVIRSKMGQRLTSNRIVSSSKRACAVVCSAWRYTSIAASSTSRASAGSSGDSSFRWPSRACSEGRLGKTGTFRRWHYAGHLLPRGSQPRCGVGQQIGEDVSKRLAITNCNKLYTVVFCISEGCRSG